MNGEPDNVIPFDRHDDQHPVIHRPEDPEAILGALTTALIRIEATGEPRSAAIAREALIR
jgi:hypothetical protein